MPSPDAFVQQLRHAILELHKALLDAQRIRYEREHGRIQSAGELLGLVLEHPAFAWLRQLSALIARLDEWMEMRDQLGDDDLHVIVNALRDLISAEHRNGTFGKPYWEIADEVPAVLVEHVKLWRLITEKSTASGEEAAPGRSLERTVRPLNDPSGCIIRAVDSKTWDIFCRVVDNYGDVGVSWRLARLVAREHGKRVRLWLDDLTVLAKLRPEIDPAREAQTLEQVEIARIRDPFDDVEVADVVVETFGCDPPEAYVHAMAARAIKPRWINLEYLSAEDWVEGSHALPSPNPRLPLTKHYFFPGFTPRTGGLLREASLLRRRDEFQRDAGAQAAFWRSLVGEAPEEGALKASLFSYADAPVESLVRACADHPGPVWIVAPAGIAATALEAFCRRSSPGDGLRCFVVPFLPQDQYDLLLWACDVNFVRGEDSFVRAQWAGRPFVWHIYPTEDKAHWIKLSAFLARYTAGLERAQAAAVSSLWETWNRRDEAPSPDAVTPGFPGAWAEFAGRREGLEAHAVKWAAALAHRRDLAAEIVDFADNLL